MTLPSEQYREYLQQLDPELRPAIEKFVTFYDGGYDLSSAEAIGRVRHQRSQRRRETNAAVATPSVRTEDRYIPGFEGDPPVRIRIYRPNNLEAGAPALLWIHGGAYVMGDLDGEDAVCARMSHNTGAVVVSVDYRLAPEHPYPAPLHDCHAAYRWILREADSLGLTLESLVVGGTSAGGGLAATLCLFLRDRHEPLPKLQLLAAPAVDDSSPARLADARIEAPPLNRNVLFNAWRSYLGSCAEGTRPPAHAAAARANNLSGLPPAYISIGSLDPLLDEDLAYARRLIVSGVSAEVHVFPRACHGFESFQPTAAISKQCLDEREAVLRGVFRKQSAVPL
jgi:acetyl esterase/lipase